MRTETGKEPTLVILGTYVGSKAGSGTPLPVSFQCPLPNIARKGCRTHDEGMNEASYYLQHNEAGKFELNVSLFMGVSRPRKWVKVDLETKDRENAEARTRLILRLSYRLGLFPAGEVPLPKVKDPQGREKRMREGRSTGKSLPRILTLN